MNSFISQKFKFYSFLSMVLLVFVHAYNLNARYLQPFSIVEERLTCTSFLEYWLANGLFRFRIPMLFIISGYLMSIHDYKPYSERTKKRLRTLLIPYLLWSAFALLLTYCLQLFPVTALAVQGSELLQAGEAQPGLPIHWGNVLYRWAFAPIAFQLWFIRSLLVYSIAYPLIVKAIKQKPVIWFGICFLLWLHTIGIHFIEAEGMLFFSLGIYIQKTSFDIEKPAKWLRLVLWLPVFLVASIIKTIIAFYLPWGIPSFIILSLLHKTTVFAGLITIWYGCDKMVLYFTSKKWFMWVCPFSFIIYAMHVPLVNYCNSIVFTYFSHVPHLRLVAFIVLPLLILLFTIAIGAIFRLVSPKLYGICTGGRGM
ncbi:acyltransferase family protein [Parasediminibacterium sp. JCM 36343]|uniref:acyltransferase family protein n=1 Tax=Parasediminibacterium sp. JCM 36343 TaxID=3374279 RepID=UPI00397A00F9